MHPLLSPPAGGVCGVPVRQPGNSQERLARTGVDRVEHIVGSVMIHEQLGALIADMRDATQHGAHAAVDGSGPDFGNGALNVQLQAVDAILPPRPPHAKPSARLCGASKHGPDELDGLAVGVRGVEHRPEPVPADDHGDDRHYLVNHTLSRVHPIRSLPERQDEKVTAG